VVGQALKVVAAADRLKVEVGIQKRGRFQLETARVEKIAWVSVEK
jgi:hypothetical protein